MYSESVVLDFVALLAVLLLYRHKEPGHKHPIVLHGDIQFSNIKKETPDRQIEMPDLIQRKHHCNLEGHLHVIIRQQLLLDEG